MRPLRSGRVVTPYSGIKETGENCPTLKLFMPCSEGSGSILHDLVQGLTWDATYDPSNPTILNTVSWDSKGGVSRTSNSFDHISSANASPINGSFFSIDGSKVYLFMASARVLSDDLCRVAIGDINDTGGYSVPAGFGMSDGNIAGTGSFHCAVGNNGSPQVRIAVGAGTDLCLLDPGVEFDCVTSAKLDPANHTIEYLCRNFDTGATLLAADTYTKEDVLSTFTPNPCMRFSGYALYGVALFEFASFPMWIDTAIYWMANQWRHAGLGKPRYIYPMLRDVT